MNEKYTSNQLKNLNKEYSGDRLIVLSQIVNAFDLDKNLTKVKLINETASQIALIFIDNNFSNERNIIFTNSSELCDAYHFAIKTNQHEIATRIMTYILGDDKEND